MTNGQRGGRGGGWFTRATMAALFGVSAQAFDKSVRPLVSPEDVRQTGSRRRLEFRGRGVLDAWCSRHVAQAIENERMTAAGAADSPALERWREARADITELERDARRGELVDRAELAEAWNVIANRLRKATEALQRKFGPEARDVIDEALDDCGRLVREALGAVDSD